MGMECVCEKVSEKSYNKQPYSCYQQVYWNSYFGIQSILTESIVKKAYMFSLILRYSWMKNIPFYFHFNGLNFNLSFNLQAMSKNLLRKLCERYKSPIQFVYQTWLVWTDYMHIYTTQSITIIMVTKTRLSYVSRFFVFFK